MIVLNSIKATLRVILGLMWGTDKMWVCSSMSAKRESNSLDFGPTLRRETCYVSGISWKLIITTILDK